MRTLSLDFGKYNDEDGKVWELFEGTVKRTGSLDFRVQGLGCANVDVVYEFIECMLDLGMEIVEFMDGLLDPMVFERGKRTGDSFESIVLEMRKSLHRET